MVVAVERHGLGDLVVDIAVEAAVAASTATRPSLSSDSRAAYAAMPRSSCLRAARRTCRASSRMLVAYWNSAWVRRSHCELTRLAARAPTTGVSALRRSVMLRTSALSAASTNLGSPVNVARVSLLVSVPGG